MKLPDLEAWAIFAAVVEHRSISAAATVLGTSKATVSKAITRLETRLGATLFHRTSRKLVLTEHGRALAERARAILLEGVAAEEAARDTASAPAGPIRMAAPLSFGVRSVAPVVAEFLRAHPGVTIDLRLSDAKVDIVADGIDVALRIADLPDSSLRARRIADIPALIVAAPAYLAAAGTPTRPAELAAHACLLYTNLPRPDRWRFADAAGREEIVAVAGPLATDSGDAMLPALLAGLGIARLPEFMLAADVAAGRLIPILQDWVGTPLGLHIVTPPGKRRPARVEALIALLADRLRDVCGLARR
jgi:DNA-binding transcriptional LysR family regulator